MADELQLSPDRPCRSTVDVVASVSFVVTVCSTLSSVHSSLKPWQMLVAQYNVHLLLMLISLISNLIVYGFWARRLKQCGKWFDGPCWNNVGLTIILVQICKSWNVLQRKRFDLLYELSCSLSNQGSYLSIMQDDLNCPSNVWSKHY